MQQTPSDVNSLWWICKRNSTREDLIVYGNCHKQLENKTKHRKLMFSETVQATQECDHLEQEKKWGERSHCPISLPTGTFHGTEQQGGTLKMYFNKQNS